MMKYLTLVILFIATYANLNPSINLDIPTEFFTSNTKLSFVPKTNYSMVALSNLDQTIYDQVNTISGKTLQNRGEAHVTVITPPEFTVLRTGGVTQQDLDNLAIKYQIQNAPIVPICLGKQITLPTDTNPREVYNILIQRSQSLLEYRKALFEIFSKNGGETEKFDPLLFYPHITLAFQKGDIFIQEGVFKSRYSCYGTINQLDTTIPLDTPGSKIILEFQNNQESLSIPNNFFNSNLNIPFTSHVGYSTVDLGNDINQTRIDLNQIAGLNLTDRGEAHITCITPPEFKILQLIGINQVELDQLAIDHQIQKTRIQPICLGRNRANGKIVYNIVIEKSIEIMNYRRSLAKLYIQKGGNGEYFDPEYFYPHITLGFVGGDVFDSNGVYKGINSCFRNIKLVTDLKTTVTTTTTTTSATATATSTMTTTNSSVTTKPIGTSYTPAVAPYAEETKAYGGKDYGYVSGASSVSIGLGSIMIALLL
ncbi:hypothetical protein HDV02_004247 [Globomyces sp. JEL0801]|nr:hypothetical protein HDV02_004247 [Globomyces sp. JEL0801]